MTEHQRLRRRAIWQGAFSMLVLFLAVTLLGGLAGAITEV